MPEQWIDDDGRLTRGKAHRGEYVEDVADSFERLREAWAPLSKAARFIEENLRVRLVEFGEQSGSRKVAALLLRPQVAKLFAEIEEFARAVAEEENTSDHMNGLRDRLSNLVVGWRIRGQLEMEAATRSRDRHGPARQPHSEDKRKGIL